MRHILRLYRLTLIQTRTVFFKKKKKKIRLNSFDKVVHHCFWITNRTSALLCTLRPVKLQTTYPSSIYFYLFLGKEFDSLDIPTYLFKPTL